MVVRGLGVPDPAPWEIWCDSAGNDPRTGLMGLISAFRRCPTTLTVGTGGILVTMPPVLLCPSAVCSEERLRPQSLRGLLWPAPGAPVRQPAAGGLITPAGTARVGGCRRSRSALRGEAVGEFLGRGCRVP
jgi:hypothetical protein